MDIATRLFTWLHGRAVGSDAAGNRYFTDKKLNAHGRTRRWVVYAGLPDATAVPAEWHCWLHYTTDAPLPETGRKPWQKPHLANATGTATSYRPQGHDYSGGKRVAASGDYEAWSPQD
jgi:NADH:ubiquinone oxidoreductase subunit